MNLLPGWLTRSLLARLLSVALLTQGLTLVILLGNVMALSNDTLDNHVHEEVRQTRDALGYSPLCRLPFRRRKDRPRTNRAPASPA